MSKPEIVFFVYSIGSGGQTLPPALDGYEPTVHLNLVGVLAMIRPFFIPGQFSFSVSLGLRGIDFSESHRLRFAFRHGDKIIADTGEQQFTEEIERKLPIEEAHIITSLTFNNIVFEYEDWYHTDVYFDGGLLDSFSIPVRKALKTE